MFFVLASRSTYFPSSSRIELRLQFEPTNFKFVVALVSNATNIDTATRGRDDLFAAIQVYHKAEIYFAYSG